MKIIKNKFLIIFILIVIVAALSYLLFFAAETKNSQPAAEEIPFKGPSGQPGVKGPLEPPPGVFNPSSPPRTEEVISFFVEGDNAGISRSPIYVKAQKTIEITFHVKTENVDSVGLRFTSAYFDTGLVAPGKEKTVRFTAPQNNFTFSLLNGDGGIKKAEGKVVVQQ